MRPRHIARRVDADGDARLLRHPRKRGRALRLAHGLAAAERQPAAAGCIEIRVLHHRRQNLRKRHPAAAAGNGVGDFPRLGIVAPRALERAAHEKHRRADARPVSHGKVLDIGDVKRYILHTYACWVRLRMSVCTAFGSVTKMAE